MKYLQQKTNMFISVQQCMHQTSNYSHVELLKYTIATIEKQDTREPLTSTRGSTWQNRASVFVKLTASYESKHTTYDSFYDSAGTNGAFFVQWSRWKAREH